MITVEYPPGNSDPVHTHHAQSLVYVLEGSIVMQVRGGAPVTLGPGETFYEGPDEVLRVHRSAQNGDFASLEGALCGGRRSDVRSQRAAA